MVNRVEEFVVGAFRRLIPKIAPDGPSVVIYADAAAGTVYNTDVDVVKQRSIAASILSLEACTEVKESTCQFDNNVLRSGREESDDSVGLGLWSTRLIRKGEKLCSVLCTDDGQYRLASHRPTDPYQRAYAVVAPLNKWIFPVGRTVKLDAFLRMNNSVHPNASWAFGRQNAGADEEQGVFRVWVEALCDIPTRTELLIIYNQRVPIRLHVIYIL